MIFSNNFHSYMNGVLSMYNGNFIQMITSLTEKLWHLMLDPNNSEIIQLEPNTIRKSLNRFYIINYNYNGNKLWCPIYAMEYKTINNKNILYAVQLDYIPPKYKIIIFSTIFYYIQKTIEENFEKSSVMQEEGLPMEPEAFYNILKNNGNMNYALTGFDFNKIEKSYLLSTKILPEIIMADLKSYNSGSMKDLLQRTQDNKTSERLKEIIKNYDKLISEYNLDSIEYHKKVKNFEKYFKLFNE